MSSRSTLFSLLSLVGIGSLSVSAQNCENYGTANGSSCACPPGLGGSTCSQPACGGTIFQGTSRNLTSSPSTSAANLTSSGCACEAGWGGFGCNVCQSASVCQTAFANVSGGTGLVPNGAFGGNATLVCNSQPKVAASGQMSCNVVNPTLQALFPGNTDLNILRNLQPSLTPLQNVTGFGADGSAYAQLWYNGVEQFYCAADSCTQTIESDNSVKWDCSNLRCTCRANTTFCGGGVTNLTQTINSLSGTLTVSCGQPSDGSSSTKCNFIQTVLTQVFGSNGLTLSGCSFGECVAQSVLDQASDSGASTTQNSGESLSGGVIAGLAVVGAFVLLALLVLGVGIINQRKARKGLHGAFGHGGVTIAWRNVSYIVPTSYAMRLRRRRHAADGDGYTDEKVILDNVNGRVEPGQMMAILGPSGAGKTTLVEILAGKQKMGVVSGSVQRFNNNNMGRGRGTTARVAFVPQQDVLPATLTVCEALQFAAKLRLPESIPPQEKEARVEEVISQLGLERVANTRIGSGERRGISGGEMRRVSIGLELVSRPDALVLDEPTSGLDSVSAARVADVLRAVAHDPYRPTAIIASIHQPSSKLYHTFDSVMVLSHGRALYSGPGGLAPARYFEEQGVRTPTEGYNVAEHLLDIASDPEPSLFTSNSLHCVSSHVKEQGALGDPEKSDRDSASGSASGADGEFESGVVSKTRGGKWLGYGSSTYAATFLTQLEVLSGREWKNLRRDKTLFLTHTIIACVLGVLCGGLYFDTGITIAGFQSRVGCLFFLGALVAFSSLSALHNLVESRPLFLRERSNMYYSPTAWLLARAIFDVVPLRVIPTIIVSSITYWMAGLADHAENFFRFLLILVLYSLAMTFFNFLLACIFHNGGIAILLSALSALYQMTFAGFFVHLNDIPPVLRWLQWLCPLKYTLEALSVNEVSSGLPINDTLQGVPVSVSASLIMQMLFGFGTNNYYRDVLILFAYIAGFGLGVIGIVYLKLRERR